MPHTIPTIVTTTPSAVIAVNSIAMWSDLSASGAMASFAWVSVASGRRRSPPHWSAVCGTGFASFSRALT